jgi:hypothetical protein
MSGGWFARQSARRFELDERAGAAEERFLAALRAGAGRLAACGVRPDETACWPGLTNVYVTVETPIPDGPPWLPTTLQVGYWAPQSVRGHWLEALRTLRLGSDDEDPYAMERAEPGTPEVYARWALDWLVTEASRPVVHREWLDGGRVIRRDWVYGGTAHRLGRPVWTGWAGWRAGRRPPDLLSTVRGAPRHGVPDDNRGP